MEMHKYVKMDSGLEMDMTPMIDIVFLLIIFFMVVTELSNLDIVELILPVATEARVEDPEPGSKTVTVNAQLHEDQINNRGVGQIVLGGEKHTAKELQNKLAVEADVFDKWIPNENDPTQKHSELEINLRADRAVHAGIIHDIYQACQKAKVYRVRLAATAEEVPRD